MNRMFTFLLGAIIMPTLIYANDKKQNSHIVYKQGNRIDFQSLLIEGEKKKAQFSVVTGNMGEVDLGLLKIRENFHDYMKDDIREEIQQ